MSKTISIQTLDSALVTLDSFNQTKDKKAHIGSLLYNGKSVPNVQLPTMRIAFGLRYKDQPGLKLNLSVDDDTTAKILGQVETVLNEVLKKKHKVKRPLCLLKPSDKYAPVLKLKVKGNGDKFQMAMVDLDQPQDQFDFRSRDWTSEQLEEILVPKLPVQAIITFAYVHSTPINTVLTCTVEGVAYKSSDLLTLRSGSSIPQPAPLIKDIDLSQITFQEPPGGAGKSDFSRFNILCNDKSLRVTLPPCKVTFNKLSYQPGDKPKLTLTLDDLECMAAMKALDAKAEEFAASHGLLKKLPYFPCLKEKDGYFPSVSLRFNPGDSDMTFRLDRMADSEHWEDINCKAIPQSTLEALFCQGRIVRPIVSVRSLFASKTTLSLFLFVEAVEILDSPQATLQFLSTIPEEESTV